jgi:hypothetical protein
MNVINSEQWSLSEIAASISFHEERKEDERKRNVPSLSISILLTLTLLAFASYM